MKYQALHVTCVVLIITFTLFVERTNGDLLKRKQKKWFNEVNGFIDVFVGICTENDNEADGVGGIGIWFNSFHPSNIGEPYEGLRPTHLKASIQGVISAIRQARDAGVYSLRIHINNKQVIDIIQNYLDLWKENNWFKSNGRVMKYKDNFIKLDEALKTMDKTEFVYVAHVGSYDESTLAYTLAKYGITRYIRTVLKPIWRATRTTTKIPETTIKELFKEVSKIQRNKTKTTTEDINS